MTNQTDQNRPRYIDVVDVAKLIRKDLRAVFGRAVKFTVRTHQYAGGSSIRVRWTDGPTKKMVQSIIGGYQGGGFDGMTDYKYSFDGFMDGERVRFGGDFLFIDRDISDAARERAERVALICDGDDDLERERRIREQAVRRVDARIFEMFAANFHGPRATADLEQAEQTRLSVYPRHDVPETRA